MRSAPDPFHSSARRHGVNDLDIQHAVEHSLAIEDIGEDQTDGLSSARIERATCSNWSSSSTSAARS
jgi:hypothetical protein